MAQKFPLYLIALFTVTALQETKAIKEVTNEEIKDAILSLVHSYNLLDNKLERHEHRERALGELVKRALQSLQRGQKAYEPMSGIFSRLDERVSQIETMLIAQEEKYNVQSDKMAEALEGIFKWMMENNACFYQRPGLTAAVAPTVDNRPKNNDDTIDKIDKLSKNVKELVKTSKDLLDETKKLVDSKLAAADDIISKLEDKLSHFYVTGPLTTDAPSEKNSEFENKVSTSLEIISETIAALKDAPKTSDKLTTSDKQFLQGLSNETLTAIEETKLDILSASDKALAKTTSRIKDSTENMDNTINEVLRTITESSESAEKFYAEVNKSYFALQDGFEVFNKFDKILLSTSDHILDTQRKVEYGTHQIILKVGELIRTLNTDLNFTMQKRFDDIDSSIVNNHLEALQNLSSTMESEISHVWRQIEIMHSEISYSKDALNKLQGQTEAYVNGTFTTMDSMEGKVGQITGRMAEVDSNLNYLLGRLSLVTQEFNQIKTGLGKALDQIRSSFQTVQEKIKDVGPGPHAIPEEEEYDGNTNLLPQRDQPTQ